MSSPYPPTRTTNQPARAKSVGDSPCSSSYGVGRGFGIASSRSSPRRTSSAQGGHKRYPTGLPAGEELATHSARVRSTPCAQRRHRTRSRTAPSKRSVAGMSWSAGRCPPRLQRRRSRCGASCSRRLRSRSSAIASRWRPCDASALCQMRVNASSGRPGGLTNSDTSSAPAAGRSSHLESISPASRRDKKRVGLPASTGHVRVL
jgi:hypothetical protein